MPASQAAWPLGTLEPALVPVLLLLGLLLVVLAGERALLDGAEARLEALGEVQAARAVDALDLNLHLAEGRDGDLHFLALHAGASFRLASILPAPARRFNGPDNAPCQGRS